MMPFVPPPMLRGGPPGGGGSPIGGKTLLLLLVLLLLSELKSHLLRSGEEERAEATESLGSQSIAVRDDSNSDPITGIGERTTSDAASHGDTGQRIQGTKQL